MRRLLAVAALAAAACAGPRTTSHASPMVGKPLDVTSRDLQGKQVSVQDAKGKVRIVDFWATWCEPCREQLPFLDKLARAHGADGLEVFGVAFDEDRAEVEQYLAATPVSFAVLWEKGGGELPEKLDVTRLPTTFFVDRAGIVRDVHLGFSAEEAPKLEALVTKLLAEKPMAEAR